MDSKSKKQFKEARTQVNLNGKWGDIDFKDLKPGDIFRQFQIDEMPVVDDSKFSKFEAISYPPKNEISDDYSYFVEYIWIT